MTLMPFDNLGYHIHFKVLNTKDYGIPQNRERIFILGIRDDKDNNFRFPKEIPLVIKLKDLLQNNVNDKYYLSKKMIKNITTPSNGNWNYGKMTFNTDIAKCINARVHKMGRADTDNYVISHSLYPASGNPKHGGTGHLSKSDGTSYCLDTGNAQAIQKQNKIRRLTPIECERLQGFPDNHTEGVSDTQRYKQCGNTITVNVMEAIFKNLLHGHS